MKTIIACILVFIILCATQSCAIHKDLSVNHQRYDSIPYHNTKDYVPILHITF